MEEATNATQAQEGTPNDTDDEQSVCRFRHHERWSMCRRCAAADHALAPKTVACMCTISLKEPDRFSYYCALAYTYGPERIIQALVIALSMPEECITKTRVAVFVYLVKRG